MIATSLVMCGILSQTGWKANVKASGHVEISGASAFCMW